MWRDAGMFPPCIARTAIRHTRWGTHLDISVHDASSMQELRRS